jgi:hypothetical protein
MVIIVLAGVIYGLSDGLNEGLAGGCGTVVQTI